MKKKTKAAEIPYQEIPDKYRLLCKMHIYEKGENRFILDYCSNTSITFNGKKAPREFDHVALFPYI